MQTQMIKTIISITSAFLLLSQAHVFAKGGGGGGVGNCNGNGNIKHGCGSSVITPDVLTQTSQGNARQPTAPIPTANQLPPQPPVTPLSPPLVPPMVPQPKPTAPPLAPKMIPQAVPPTVSSTTPMFVASPLASPQLAPEPKVEVTLKASSAGFNRNMISNIPGRQPADSYAIFRNDATGVYRECVVSGLERRKVILPNGEIIYRGTLPSLRTVSNELSDIPSWHPHEAGCIISIEHKKR